MGDTIFIFCLALILFGPKKLPEIGRQIGKLMVEFRRASNEFKMQIEEELRVSDETERQKEITAAAAARASIPASSSELLAASVVDGAATATAPMISTPSTGLPVNHTFQDAGGPDSSNPDSIAEHAFGTAPLNEATDGDAYPEPANGFNPDLNTASNGLNTETPLVADILQSEAASEVVALELPVEVTEKAQAPAHHG